MPKTKLSEKYKPKYPPIDEALGVVLARKWQMGLDLKTIADRAGYSYEGIRKAFTRAPKDWTPDMRDAILAVLGLKAKLVITDVDE
jgi:hypothetical protein